MACEILIVATAKPGLTKKGYPFRVKQSPCAWSTVYTPPNWVILHVTGADASDVKHFFIPWKKSFVYTILQDVPTGYRIKVEVDPLLVSAGNANKEMRVELKTHIVNHYEASIVSYDSFEAIIDIPKPLMYDPGEGRSPYVIDLQGLKNDILDRFDEIFAIRKYRFTDADVDTAVVQGGIIELTKTQVLSRIIIELEE